jgi:hypothetical protein
MPDPPQLPGQRPCIVPELSDLPKKPDDIVEIDPAVPVHVKCCHRLAVNARLENQD